MAAKVCREIGLNFIARMKEADLHNKYKRGPIYQREVNTRMIEFFTGAYIALRTFDRVDDAREVGVFTKTVLAPLGYQALCRAVDGQDVLPDKVALIQFGNAIKN